MSDAFDILTALTIEDGRTWGEAAAPVQLADAAAILTGEVPYHAISRARGFSKTTDLAGIALAAALTAPRGARLYWAAADLDQGKLALDSIIGFRDRTDALRSQLEIQARGVVIPTTGTRIEILPADAPGSWGLRPYLIVCDELAQWPETDSARRLWEALTSSMLKVHGARLAIITTAGSPSHWAAKVFESAATDPLWRVSETPGAAPWTDPAMLAEQRRRLPEAIYAQLFENAWTLAEGAFFDQERMEACFSLDGPAEHPATASHFAGLDIGLVNDATAFTVGHRVGDQVHLDLVKAWRGTKRRPVQLDEVEEFVIEAWQRYRFRLSADPFQAVGLMQRLRAKGLRASDYNFSQGSKAKLATTLLQAVNDGSLHLFDAEGLRDELLNLRVRQMSSGAWTFDHTRKGHDDLATALALMTLAAVKTGTGQIQARSNPIWNSTDVADTWFDRTGVTHDSSPRHRRWSQTNFCADCAREWREQLIADGREDELPRVTRLI